LGADAEMTRVAIRLFAFFAVLGASCSVAPYVVVVNASDVALELAVKNQSTGPRFTGPRQVRIDPGRWKELRPGDDFEDVHLRAGGCDLRYRVPQVFSTARLTPEQQVDPESPWAHYPVVVEVAPDFTIFYQRGNERARVVPIEQLAAHQGYGFPVRPLSKTCR
jgi:hypothetical protein